MPRLRASDGQRKPEVLSQKAHSQGAFFFNGVKHSCTTGN